MQFAMDLILPSSAFQFPLFHEPLVVPRQHVGLDLLDGIKSHPHHDQQGCPSKVERDIESPDEDRRQNADRRNIKGSPQGNPGQDFVDVFGSFLAWSEARDIAAEFFHILCHIIWVEGHGRVEIAEEDDESDIEEVVEQGPWSQAIEKGLNPRVVLQPRLRHEIGDR